MTSRLGKLFGMGSMPQSQIHLVLFAEKINQDTPFPCTFESVLLYNSETWSLTKQMEKSLDGAYTRMLRMALNASWKQHMTNEQLYGHLPPVSSKIAARHLRLAGHCIRHPEEIAS